MTAAVRARVARALSQELRELEAAKLAERIAITCDGGFGIAALTAVTALPAGPRRALEAATWARRAAEREMDVFTVIRPDMTRDEADALVELHVALAKYAA